MKPKWAVFTGDALELLRTLPDRCVDSVVTDPPAGIFFMGRHWDSDKGGAAQWVAWLTEIMRECLRVLKPGGHMLVWALPRTSHRTGTAIEAAGFECIDVITHHYGSGMPKSCDVSKQIDKKLAQEWGRIVEATSADKGGTYGVGVANSEPIKLTRTLGGSPEARQWDGWGTGLKPSSEHWILARKPRDGTLADNVMAHGVGGINVDGCRVGTDWNEPDRPASWAASAHSAKPEAEKIAAPPGVGMILHPGGRWPPNAVFTHSASCSPAGCAADCPVRLLEAQSGVLTSGAGNFKRETAKGHRPNTFGVENRPPGTQMIAYGDTGTAARFFPRFEWSGELDDPFIYASKASTKEREAGCESIPPAENGRHNDHVTVKSVALVRWLTRLVTPPGGLCLDTFTGSGTIGVACVLEGFNFMGFEIGERFAEISRARIEYWASKKS